MMSRVKLAMVTFAVICSLLTVIPPCYASEELKGTFRVLLEQTGSSVKATDIAYPSNNPRDSCTVKLPDEESLASAVCPTCRPGGQQWLQYEDYLLAVVGSKVMVFSSSGELCAIQQALPLQCSPRELLLAPFGQYPLVLCLASPIPAYQKIHLRSDGTFTHNNRLFQAGSDDADDAALFPSNYTGNGVVIGQYFVYIIENIIEANDIDDAIPFELYWDGSDEKCGTLQELRGRAVDEHLMRLYVTCKKDGTTKIFQLSAEDLLIVDETDVPVPRNGEISIHNDFFAIWGEEDVTVYNASSPSSYFHHSYDHTVADVTFLDQKSRRPFLLVSLYGTTRSLINVEKGFLDQDGGVYNLPGTGTSCPTTGGCLPHMLIGPDSSYLTVFTPQSNGNNGAQIFDLRSANPSDPLSPVEDIFGDPLYLMFYMTPTPSIGYPVTPTPSIGPPTSSPTDPTQSLSTGEIVGIAVAVGIPVVGVVITIVVCCAVSKRKKKGLPPPIQAMEQHPLPRVEPSGQESSTDEGRGQSKPIQESNNRDSITIVHVTIQGEDDSTYGTDSNPSNSATSSRSNSVSRSASPADGGTAPSSPVGMKKHPPVSTGLEKGNSLVLPTIRT